MPPAAIVFVVTMVAALLALMVLLHLWAGAS
jgi:hypothetical protein